MAPSDSKDGAGSPSFVARVSRRVRACDECRRHKIRCDLKGDDDGLPCVRCARMGLTCRLTKSLQSILDERSTDERWRVGVERKLDVLFGAVQHVLGAGGAAQGPEQRELLQQLHDAINNKDDGDDNNNGTASAKRARIASDDVAGTRNPLGMLADAASDNEVAQSWDAAEALDPASAPGQHLSQFDDGSAPMQHANRARKRGTDTLDEAVPSRLQSTTASKRTRSDIIERGIVTLSQTHTLVDIYLQHLDPHVYSIVASSHCASDEQHALVRLRSAVQSIRRGSPLLLLAVCTVAALHCAATIRNDGVQAANAMSSTSSEPASRLYTTLHDEFIRVSAQQSFVRHQSLDDIRALLIGSWWLRDLSWILTGSAVRLATERGMQEAYKRCSDMQAGRSMLRMRATEVASQPGEAVAGSSNTPAGKAERDAYEAARLYYLVYVADHEAAIPFARPPMTRQHAAVRNVHAWLAGCALATEEDARLASQVELWVIAHDVVDDFGVDVQQAMSREQVFELMPRFFALVDRWQTRWQHARRQQKVVMSATTQSTRRRRTTNGKAAEEANMSSPLDGTVVHAEMMRLFIAAHVLRAPADVDPLTIEDVQDGGGWGSPVAERPTFAQLAMPDLPSPAARRHNQDERRARFEMGCDAVRSAVRLIEHVSKNNGDDGSPSGMYGQPIYPFAMVIFACLFLHKLSKRSGNPTQRRQTRTTLPGCTLAETLAHIERVADALQRQVMPFCVAEHICGTVLPGLSSVLRSERASGDVQPSYTAAGVLDSLMVMPELPPAPAPMDVTFDGLTTTADTPVFSFDLQSLDLLSDLRYLSGVANDSTFWELPMGDDGGTDAAAAGNVF